MKTSWIRYRVYNGFFSLLTYFIVTGVIIYITFMSFLNKLDITADEARKAAPGTFVAVVLITFIIFLLDLIWRRLTVEEPIKRMQAALEKVRQGDFNVQIDHRFTDRFSGFSQIIDSINLMTMELSGVETLKTDFIASVSHELKTPLASIQNYASLLNSPVISEKERIDYSSAVIRAAERLTALITNILRLNRLENQNIYPEPVKFDLVMQVSESILLFEDEWERKNISIETDMNERIEVFSDPELLSIVWNNLISNAVKFTPEGGSISVSVTDYPGKTEVCIRDSGCGISPEIRNRIFDKFFKGDPSRSTPGNGLGLSLVKRIMEILNCNIDFTSEAGKGSKFRVCIPGHGNPQ